MLPLRMNIIVDLPGGCDKLSGGFIHVGMFNAVMYRAGMLKMINRVYSFYHTGFRQMTIGRTLWKIILIKLVVIFTVLKVLFFPDYLDTQFDTDEQKAEHVLEQITRQVNQNDK